ncbi:hypothetical protein MBLNU457_g1030t1 [Dothideomycetes sp. NU457]
MTRSPLPIHTKTRSSTVVRKHDTSTKPKVLLVKLRYKPLPPASLLVKLRYKPLPATSKNQEPAVPRKANASVDPKLLLTKIRDRLDYEKRHGITAEEPWRRVRYHLEQLDQKDPLYVRNARVRRKTTKRVYELWLREQPDGREMEEGDGGNGGAGVVERKEVLSECEEDKRWEEDLDRVCPWQ